MNPQTSKNPADVEAPELEEVGLLTVLTLVIWIGCLVVGLTGLLAEPPPAPPPATQPQPVVAELVTLETLEPMPAEAQPVESQPRQNNNSPAPPLPVVAAPSPAIPFALPVKGLFRLGTPAEAVPVAPSSVVQRLTFGQGEGNQPQPEYPIEAQLAGQEGTVVVRFTIGPDGRVSDAQAISPCPWPLLNQAAVRGVRDSWRFSPGPIRLREVSIQYQSKQ